MDILPVHPVVVLNINENKKNQLLTPAPLNIKDKF
jgi:hypothetical protein